MNLSYLSYLVLAATFSIVVISFFIKAVKKSRGIELLPALFWLILAVTPLAIQYPYFSPHYAPLQAVGVLILGLAILAGDIYSLSRRGFRVSQGADPKSRVFLLNPKADRIILGTVVASILGAQLLHLWLMPKIPLLEKFKTHGAEIELTAPLQDFETRWNSIRIHDLLQVWESKSNNENDHALQEKLKYIQIQSNEWSLNNKNFNEQYAEHLKNLPMELRQILSNCAEKLDENWRVYLTSITSLKGLSRIGAEQRELITDIGNKGRRDADYCRRDYQGKHFSLLRENSSKKLAISSVLIYFVQSMLLITPALVFFLIKRRSFAISFILIIFSLLYSRATLAKGPLYVMILLYLTLAWQNLSKSLRRKLILLGAPLAVAMSIFMLHFYSTHNFSIFRFRAPLSYQEKILDAAFKGEDRGGLTFTITDHYRSMSFFFSDPLFNKEEQKKAIPLQDHEGYFNFIAYRALLAPIEVAQRWYAYYPDLNNGYLGWYGITPSSRHEANYQHPANTVARQTYVRMYPEIYLDTAFAYASVDADAHARWGFIGVIAVAFFIFSLRTLSARLPNTNALDKYLYWTSLVVISISMPAASFQAILLAQGLGIFLTARLGLTGIWFMWVRLVKRKSHSFDSATQESTSTALLDRKPTA